MEQDLLRYLLAAFPPTGTAPAPDRGDDDCLVIHGYRVPFASPVDETMLAILAEFRRTGFRSDGVAGIDRG